jgi:hypothetical protein
VDIVESKTETIQQAPGQVIRFSLKGVFQTPGEPAPAAATVAKNAPKPK